MKISIISVRDPVWANAEKTLINCVIRSTAYSEDLPFTADPNDCEPHSREIFIRCLSGEFGEIGPYIPSEYKLDKSEITNPTWVRSWPEVHDFITEANLENSKNSPRAIGLIWGSMLKKMFDTFIQEKLQYIGREGDSLRYKNGKKCGDTFESKIKAALSEGMIDIDLANSINAIRRIRNACAHEWRLNYNNENITALKPDFSLLKQRYFPIFNPDDIESLIKMVYSSACCAIIIFLAEHAAIEHRT